MILRERIGRRVAVTDSTGGLGLGLAFGDDNAGDDSDPDDRSTSL
ncbi:hypothetical protein [Halorubrum sp. GN11_10-6_MGM]|nr:hypothetical protein [Halorubrum sp. GN11_10-6_MGM]